MKTLSILALALFSVSAQAEVITCNFTEPFITMNVNEEAKTIEVIDNSMDETHFYQMNEFGTEKDGRTRVGYGEGIDASVLIYVKDGKGTDGMSDMIYPYSAESWASHSDVLYGACYTASNPPREPEEHN